MAGLCFDAFEVGQAFRHEIRRTVTEADNVLFSAIRAGVRAVVTRFGDDDWLARDDGVFPFEFHRAMADAGGLGVTLPPA